MFGLLSPIRDSLAQIQFSFGDNTFSLLLALQVIFGSALAVLFAVTIGQFIENRLMKVDLLDMNARVMLNKILKITLYVVAVVIYFHQFRDLLLLKLKLMALFMNIQH